MTLPDLEPVPLAEDNWGAELAGSSPPATATGRLWCR